MSNHTVYNIRLDHESLESLIKTINEDMLIEKHDFLYWFAYSLGFICGNIQFIILNVIKFVKSIFKNKLLYTLLFITLGVMFLMLYLTILFTIDYYKAYIH